MTGTPTFADDTDADDYHDRVVEFARKVADDDAISASSTRVTVTVRGAYDTPLGAEVFVEERGNEGLWIDDSVIPPEMKGDGSEVSKRVQDLARDFFGVENYRVGQYEDDVCSKTTVTPLR